MAMAMAVAGTSTPLPPLRLHRPLSRREPTSALVPPPPRTRRRSLLSALSSSSSSSSWEREEARWEREEQRWLREEARWGRERETLLREISALNEKIEELEREKKTPTLSLEALLRVMKSVERERERERERESVSLAALVEQGELKEMILEGGDVAEERDDVAEERDDVAEERRMLRMGAEGEDVRVMQEALHKLGFYSGEEDMEFESFSSGTERAVKTWQASIGYREDGVMSLELLEMLLDGRGAQTPFKGDGNSTASMRIEEEIKRKAVKEEIEEEEMSERRVFLLGENRWEDPARLAEKNGPIGPRATTMRATIRCVTCRGEGRLLCTECDGTGEPNIEPQFMEWVDEGTKCPYCEGLGYITCDACGGQPVS